MIAKQHRFHGQRSLSLAYRHGSTVRNQQMSVKFISNRRRSTYRAAIIVSRKVSKLAVDRNRIRRRLYEVIHTHEQDIIEPYDVILTVFSDQIAELPAPKLTTLVVELLARAHILKSVSDSTEHAHAIVKPKEDGS